MSAYGSGRSWSDGSGGTDGAVWAVWASYSGLYDEVRGRCYRNGGWSTFFPIPGVTGDASAWVRVPDASRYGRGGLLPMAVFLTQNAPGLRTSPVKRGYWLVRRVLGEQIPPPPAVVPELPHDEAKLELPLREVLARHREDAACAGCHARFDALGLAFEGYGPVGELRTKDLAGRPVDAGATFPISIITNPKM